jgi:hypothetical protein
VTREESLSIWGPAGSPWSRWVKAVLFSFMHDRIPDNSPGSNAQWTVPLLQDTALILNLPGPHGVYQGVAIAAVGYRPIPLYNACPYAIEDLESDPIPSILTALRPARINSPAVIDVIPIMRALETETGALRIISLPALAPPAFLVDADRHNAAVNPTVGWFDNRSIIRQSDLPTAEFLRAHGIRQVVLVQSSQRLQADMQSVLLPWQDAGLSILRQTPGELWSPTVYRVSPPSFLKNLWNQVLFPFRYRLNGSDAFGGFVHGSAG